MLIIDFSQISSDANLLENVFRKVYHGQNHLVYGKKEYEPGVKTQFMKKRNLRQSYIYKLALHGNDSNSGEVVRKDVLAELIDPLGTFCRYIFDVVSGSSIFVEGELCDILNTCTEEQEIEVENTIKIGGSNDKRVDLKYNTGVISENLVEKQKENEIDDDINFEVEEQKRKKRLLNK